MSDDTEYLCRAAAKDKVHQIEKALKEKQVPVDSPSVSCERTALMLASAWNAKNAVQLLLR